MLTPVNRFDLTPPPLFSLLHFRTRSPTESKLIVFSMHNISYIHELLTDKVYQQKTINLWFLSNHFPIKTCCKGTLKPKVGISTNLQDLYLSTWNISQMFIPINMWLNISHAMKRGIPFEFDENWENKTIKISNGGKAIVEQI